MSIDVKTQMAYAENAIAYSQDWISQPEPTDIYQLVKKFFIPEGTTAGIGCGNGRDPTGILFSEDKISVSSQKQVSRLVWRMA